MKTFVIALACLLAVSVSYAGKTRVVEKRVPTKPNQRIEVNGISGSQVSFRSWDKDEVYVHLTVSMSSSDEGYEDAYVAGVSIDDVSTSDMVRLTFREGSAKERSGSWLSRIFGQFFVNKEISGEVYVPQRSALMTDMKYGSMTLDGMASDVELLGASNALVLRNCASVRRVENNYGTTRIENSGGAATIIGASSKVTVTDFTGSVDIDANYSTVTLARIAKDLQLVDQSGTVSVDGVGGSAAIDADYSTVTIARVKGAAKVRATSGTVNIREAGAADVDARYSSIDIVGISGSAGKDLIVRSESGSLAIGDVTANVMIDNPYSTVRLERVRGNVSVNTTSGTIEASDVAGDWRSVSPYSSVSLRRLSAGSISITTSSNAVRVSCRTVPTSVAIRNDYGGVRFSMPQGFSGTVDLDAEYGTVDTNLPVRIRTRSESASATGKIGTRSGSILVETKSGNIDLTEDREEPLGD
jgi:DUF4097 and DUF4098 domain-containing protein YvlB